MDKPASVHRGTLLRWFEELCRIKHEKLEGVVKRGQRAMAGKGLPGQGGVYVFWWTGSRKHFHNPECQRIIHLHGPGG